APGIVVASPSQSDPDYYFHWVRDAALVTNALIQIGYQIPALKNRVEMHLNDFVEATVKQQTSKALTGLGEPKFFVDGSPFDGPWGRPQNDGPALRAITLINWANLLIDQGEIVKVRTLLYDSRLPTQSPIKRDLEYVSQNWREPSFDIWEEVKGDHFYTRYVQMSALVKGEGLARRLGDSRAADWYRAQAEEVQDSLDSFFDLKKGTLRTTLNQVDGLNYKSSELDVAVVLGILHGDLWDATHFTPKIRSAIDKTIEELKESFNEIYPINYSKNKKAVILGRYPEDRYFGGHPWFLTTFAIAEYYRKTKQNLVEADGLMAEGLYHAGANCQMDEQIHRESGYMLSAYDLTWSYAAFLTAHWSEPQIK
ncbi:MAG: glycoside hydrolase family 15 protein, partial [Bdellovibrionales bacterium]|nr:glycoside hydrolase family 15 protein [Bdellovibrionales bacterium]